MLTAQQESVVRSIRGAECRDGTGEHEFVDANRQQRN